MNSNWVQFKGWRGGGAGRGSRAGKREGGGPPEYEELGAEGDERS